MSELVIECSKALWSTSSGVGEPEQTKMPEYQGVNTQVAAERQDMVSKFAEGSEADKDSRYNA